MELAAHDAPIRRHREVDLDAAAENLADLAASVTSGAAEVILVRDGKPVARLVSPHGLPTRQPGDADGPMALSAADPMSGITLPPGPPVFGVAEGEFVVPDDFDEPLEEFKEYM